MDSFHSQGKIPTCLFIECHDIAEFDMHTNDNRNYVVCLKHYQQLFPNVKMRPCEQCQRLIVDCSYHWCGQTITQIEEQPVTQEVTMEEEQPVTQEVTMEEEQPEEQTFCFNPRYANSYEHHSINIQIGKDKSLTYDQLYEWLRKCQLDDEAREREKPQREKFQRQLREKLQLDDEELHKELSFEENRVSGHELLMRWVLASHTRGGDSSPLVYAGEMVESCSEMESATSGEAAPPAHVSPVVYAGETVESCSESTPPHVSPVGRELFGMYTPHVSPLVYA